MFNLSSFLIYMLITAFTPGPNNITSMAKAARYGFRKSYPYNFGMWVAFMVVMILCALFSTVLQNLVPTIKPYLIGAGSVYLLYLAWETWKSPSLVSEVDKNSAQDGSSIEQEPVAECGVSERNSAANEEGFWRLFLQGALLQFMNPKIIIYGITSLSVYVVPIYKSPVVISLFAILLASVGSTSTVVWAVLGSRLRILFSKHHKIVNGILALLLVWCMVSLYL